MDYDFLKPTEQARIVTQRLVNAEREHFQLTVDDNQTTPSDPQAIKDVEARLEALRAKLAELEKSTG